MKRLISILAKLLICICVEAQQDSIELQEIVVEGARTVSKADRTIVYPSATILDASTSGYSLINRLMLPGIRVDEVTHAITSTINDGTVQLRINNIVVDKQEILSLDMASVVSIEYIDNPGVRYGEGIAKVINILTRRAVGGYTLGADLGNAVTTWLGNNMVYGKLNRGADEFTLSYNNSYSNSKDYSNSETANYLLTSGDTKTITRQGIDQQQKNFGNQFALCFNRNKEGLYQFQAKLSSDFANTPTSRCRKLITDGTDSYYANYDSHDRSAQPTLDLYYDLQIDTAQALRINAVGTYIKSSYRYAYDEG